MLPRLVEVVLSLAALSHKVSIVSIGYTDDIWGVSLLHWKEQMNDTE